MAKYWSFSYSPCNEYSWFELFNIDGNDTLYGRALFLFRTYCVIMVSSLFLSEPKMIFFIFGFTVLVIQCSLNCLIKAHERSQLCNQWWVLVVHNVRVFIWQKSANATLGFPHLTVNCWKFVSSSWSVTFCYTECKQPFVKMKKKKNTPYLLKLLFWYTMGKLPSLPGVLSI